MNENIGDLIVIVSKISKKIEFIYYCIKDNLYKRFDCLNQEISEIELNNLYKYTSYILEDPHFEYKLFVKNKL